MAKTSTQARRRAATSQPVPSAIHCAVIAGQFERTLIIVDEGAKGLAGCAIQLDPLGRDQVPCNARPEASPQYGDIAKHPPRERREAVDLAAYNTVQRGRE